MSYFFSKIRSKELALDMNPGSIQIVLMTSSSTDEAIKNYLNSNNYFCLQPNQVHFIKQKDSPCLSLQNKLIYSDTFTLLKLPNGNGGILEILYNSDVYFNLIKLGVEFLHITSIDNVLFNPLDSLFVGSFFNSNSDVCIKVVPREDKNESTGILCKRDDGKIVIQEYSLVLDEIRYSVNPETNELKFNYSNICQFLMKLSIFEKFSKINFPYHVALKKNNFF